MAEFIATVFANCAAILGSRRTLALRASHAYSTLMLIARALSIALFCLGAAACEDVADAPQALCDIPASEGRIALPGGTFTMGSDSAYREEGPARAVTVQPFEIDAHEVTNRQFTVFVEATGYVTEAEKPPPSVPGTPEEMQVPGSALFAPPSASAPNWWRWQPGASWRAPDGPGTDLAGREDHPVVHVTLADAQAYAAWAGASIPTAAEWEYAARGGLEGAAYAWGETRMLGETHMANTWQGVFPLQNTARDGFSGTAPIGCYPPNGYGLYDMIGNVWELTADAAPNGQGTVIKGGSYLCAANYCRRYRPAAWQAQDQGLGTNHIGFRTIKRR